MTEDVVVKVTADVSQFKAAIGEAIGEVEKLHAALDSAKEVWNSVQDTDEAKELRAANDKQIAAINDMIKAASEPK